MNDQLIHAIERLEDKLERDLINRPEETTLYRLFDSGGVLLYVGITGRDLRRTHQHAKTKAWWIYVAGARFEHFLDRSSALKAEAKAIRTENPLFNRAGARRSRKRPPCTWCRERPAASARGVCKRCEDYLRKYKRLPSEETIVKSNLRAEDA